MQTNSLTMEMLGFGCPSCVYTIEKLGRKIPGIEKIAVSLGQQRIRIEYTGDRDEIIRQVTGIVQRIGHEVRELPAEAQA